MGLLALLLPLATAVAADCRAPLAELKEATPASTATAWQALAACDPKLATAQLESAFGRMLPGDAAHDALLTAMDLGEQPQALAWIFRQEPGHQSAARAALGHACDEHETVLPFLLSVADEQSKRFWSERWYRSVGECHQPQARTWLEEQLDIYAKEEQGSTFGGLAEVYAKHARAESLPKLNTLAEQATSEVQLIAAISAFGDAVDVGSVDGLNREAAKEAGQLLLALAPKMSFRAVEAARVTLQSMSQDEAASELARFRWPARTTHGAYTYGISVREQWTCKNGKAYDVLHHATFSEGGHHWPDELVAIAEKPLISRWGLGEAAQKCKGEATLAWEIAPSPFGEDNVQQKWLERIQSRFEEGASEAKQSVIAEAAFSL